MNRIPLCLIIIFFFTLPALAQKQITGVDRVNANGQTSYSLNVKAEAIEWSFEPPLFGKIVQGQGTEKITVQWNLFSTGLKTNSTCSIIASVIYPNSETPLYFAKQISIKNFIDSSKYRQSLNFRFSKTSKDSLRFFYKLNCDSSINYRELVFTDSSLQKTNTQNWNWLIKSRTSEKQFTGSTKDFTLRLQPGHYSITLKKQNAQGKIFSLTDTLTIYQGAKPTFTISNQLPCSGALITFSNTSKRQDLTLNSTFYFGNGNSQKISWPQKTTAYSYDDKGLVLVLMTYMEVKDLYSCAYKSNEIAIANQENEFTLTNVFIEPRYAELKKEKDSVIIKCVMGGGFSPANPNEPFNYLWNTGQTSPEIIGIESGIYSLVVSDRYGCKSERLGPARIVKLYTETKKPKIAGPANVKAGTKLIFKIEERNGCLYQWKFIYNGGTAITTEPSSVNKIIPEGWEKSKPGTLKVIGIILNQKEGTTKSSYSDTLLVKIY